MGLLLVIKIEYKFNKVIIKIVIKINKAIYNN